MNTDREEVTVIMMVSSFLTTEEFPVKTVNCMIQTRPLLKILILMDYPTKFSNFVIFIIIVNVRAGKFLFTKCVSSGHCSTDMFGRAWNPSCILVAHRSEYGVRNESTSAPELEQ